MIRASAVRNCQSIFFDRLLQWHEQDPVDDLERDRNDVVFGFRENKNPFIDNPECVACLFMEGLESRKSEHGSIVVALSTNPFRKRG